MSTATKPETIQWHVLPDGGMPDAEIDVLLEFIHTDEPDNPDTWPGWWSGPCARHLALRRTMPAAFTCCMNGMRAARWATGCATGPTASR